MTETEEMAGTAAGAGAWPADFTDPRGFGRPALWALRVCVAMEALRALTLAGFLFVTRSIEQGGDPRAMVALLNAVGFPVATGAGVAELAALVLGAWWLARAHGNLPALGARRLRWSPRWAVFGWVIPVANLAIPYLVANETWRASVPGAEGTGWRAAPGSPRAGAAWGLLLMAVVMGLVAVATPDPNRVSPDVLLTYVGAGIVGALAALFASLAMLKVMGEVNARQLATAQGPRAAD